jgi:hypothetical protein
MPKSPSFRTLAKASTGTIYAPEKQPAIEKKLESRETRR